MHKPGSSHKPQPAQHLIQALQNIHHKYQMRLCQVRLCHDFLTPTPPPTHLHVTPTGQVLYFLGLGHKLRTLL